jgi:hypothetical protein
MHSAQAASLFQTHLLKGTSQVEARDVSALVDLVRYVRAAVTLWPHHLVGNHPAHIAIKINVSRKLDFMENVARLVPSRLIVACKAESQVSTATVQHHRRPLHLLLVLLFPYYFPFLLFVPTLINIIHFLFK